MNARRPLLATALAALFALPAPAFDVGADLSSLPQVEAGGGVFRDGRRAGDALAILKRNGFTSVRLRLWHTPADGAGGLDATLAMAKRVKRAGLSLLLDIHFSDTWADPGHQSPPAAWRDLDDVALARTAGTYTRGVIEAFVAQGTPPAAVQLGNEIDDGMLWEAARLGPGAGSPEGHRELAAVLASAARGVRAACPKARIVLHLSAGGDAAACERVLDPLAAARVPFDVVGVSYYPWWHGTLEDLAATLKRISTRYGCDVMVVETGYPWTLRWMDLKHNIVGSHEQLLEDYGASPAGQATFARALRYVLQEVPADRGVGVWWWEPAWIATPRGHSPWENCALFDSTGRLLPAARALAQ